MPKGPQGQKREADVIGNAVLVMRIATGEAQDSKRDTTKLRALVQFAEKLKIAGVLGSRLGSERRAVLIKHETIQTSIGGISPVIARHGAGRGARPAAAGQTGRRQAGADQ